GVLVNRRSAVTRNVPGKRAALEHAIQNFFYPEGKTVGLGDALDFWFAVASPQNSGELAETIKALVVHLDRDNTLEFRPDFFKTIRQRMDVAQVERRDFFALFSRHFHRVMDRAV